MQNIPLQLISTKEKTKKISDTICKNCILLRRTDLEEYLTPFDEIDVELIRDIDLFRMSTHILFCDRENIGLENQIKHANIVIIEGENPKFTGDNSISEDEIANVKVQQKETLILGFKKENLDNITGPYILQNGKKTQNLNYNIQVTYDPLVLNCFHMEAIINCSESGEEIKRKKPNGYMQAIASDIKVKLMNKKKVEIYNYEDISE